MHSSVGVSAARPNPVSLRQQSEQSSDSCSPSSTNGLRAEKNSHLPAQTTDVSLTSRAISVASDLIHWSIENRLGMAKLFGTLVVPAQFTRSHLSSSQDLSEACTAINQKHDHVLQCDEAIWGDTKLTIAVCYPPAWPAGDKSRCVLYHNPNGITVNRYFQSGRQILENTQRDPEDFCYEHRHPILKGIADDLDTNAVHCLGLIQDIRRCTIIFYDYRGVGFNKQATPLFPTYETIVQDGLATLNYALTHFNHVEIFGTSLGGAVATASVDRYPDPPESLTKRVKVNVLDSFTTTPQVLFPNCGPWIDNLGWFLGAYLDGAAHADNLIRKGFKIAVSNHVHDEVIPPRAQLATHILGQGDPRANVQVHLGGRKIDQFMYLNHGSLTEDVQEFLNKS